MVYACLGGIGASAYRLNAWVSIVECRLVCVLLCILFVFAGCAMVVCVHAVCVV